MTNISEIRIRTLIRLQLLKEVQKVEKNSEKISIPEIVRYIRDEIHRFGSRLESTAIEKKYPFLRKRLDQTLIEIEKDIENDKYYNNAWGLPEQTYAEKFIQSES